MPDPTLEQLTEREDFAERVGEEVTLLAGFWGAGARDINVDPGTPLRDLVVTPSAEAGVLNLERVDVIRKASSLYELVQNPDLADPDSVDRILTNHPTLKRRVDAPAQGYLALYMPDDSITAVPRNSRFTAGELVYTVNDAYICTPGVLSSPNNRPLTPLSDGTWVFTVPAVANGVGEKYNIKAGTELAWTDTRTRVVRVAADTDFSGGVDPETNTELLERLDAGLAAPGDAGRMNIHAMLLSKFPFLVDISLIGGGDSEMRRDGRNLLGLKVGGKTDAYIRTTYNVVVRKVALPAAVIDSANGVLQLYVGRDVYPGFYDMMSIRRKDQTELDPALTVQDAMYGCDIERLDYDPPEMQDEADYRFTRFQTFLVRFEDPNYDPDDLTYVVSLLGIPNIGDLQDYVSRRDVRSPNNDMLIKAAIPTLVKANLTVEYVESGPEVDLDACRAAAEAAINRTRFEHGKLSTTGIVHGVQDMLPSVTAQLQPPVDLLGTTIYPGGEVRTKRSTLELIPDILPDDSASPRTISFFIAGVEVTLKPVVRLQV
jgi:hypothetical protein